MQHGLLCAPGPGMRWLAVSDWLVLWVAKVTCKCAHFSLAGAPIRHVRETDLE